MKMKRALEKGFYKTKKGNWRSKTMGGYIHGGRCKECNDEFITPKHLPSLFCGKSCAFKGENNVMYGRSGELSPTWGRKHTEEERKKISDKCNNKGENNPMFGRLGEDNPNYGRKNTEETKKKMSAAAIGKPKSKEHKEKMRLSMTKLWNDPTSTFNTEEYRKKLRGGPNGEYLTCEKGRDMWSKEYKSWRNEIFERDNWTCQMCGKNDNLQSHHIRKWSEFKDLRHDVKNGITLCKKCHMSKVNFKEHLYISEFDEIVEKNDIEFNKIYSKT